MTNYIRTASMTASVLSLIFLGGPAFAQEKTQDKPPVQGQVDGAAAPISDQKIEAFAVAYLQVDKVRKDYSVKLGATTDAAAKQTLQTEASKQMIKTVAATPGISVDEYSSILTAAQNDPALAKRLEEKLQPSPPAQQ
jgi:hypothetical protein